MLTATAPNYGTKVDLLDTETETTKARLGQLTLCGVVFPAGWSGGDLTPQVSRDDGATWLPLFDPATGNDIVIGEPNNTTVARQAKLDPADYIGVDTIRFVAASAASADHELILVLRRFT